MKIVLPDNLAFGPLYAGLTTDADAKHYRKMGQAIWLYLYLIANANFKTGILTSQFNDIASEMGLPEATVRSWLGHLTKRHYVSVRRERGEVVFKIAKWKTFPLEPAETLATGQVRKSSKLRKLPSFFSSNKVLTESEAQKLAQYIANDFKETKNLHFILAVCRQHSTKIIKEAFTKVSAMPAERIRKSRSALFIYLTKKYAQGKQQDLGN